MSKDKKCDAGCGCESKLYQQKDGETFEQFFNRAVEGTEQAKPEPARSASDEALIAELRRKNSELGDALRDTNTHMRDVRHATQVLFEALVGVSKADSADAKTLIARNALLEYVFRSLNADGLLDGIECLRYEDGMLDLQWDEEQWVE